MLVLLQPHDRLLLWDPSVVNRAGPCLRPGPQGTLKSQPIGAAKWGICLQDQPQELCLPKGGVPRARQGRGLVRRENEVSRGWVSKSEHSTSGRGHLSRHTQESLGEKEKHTQVH